MRTKVLPVLAAGLMASQLAACQWMGGGEQAAAKTQAGQTAATQAAQAQQQPTQVAQPFVQRIQGRLEAQGYDVGAVDGMWGPGTSNALRNFQRAKGLQASGQIDEQTLAALGMIAQQAQPQTQTQPQAKPTGRQGAMMMDQDRPMRRQAMMTSPEMVREVQQKLKSRGYDVGTIDGIWGNRTASALKSFQRDSDMQASGQLTGETLAELGMSGSQLGEMPQGGTEPQQGR